MSIFKHLEAVNPLLVDFIATATSTVRERQRSTYASESDMSKHVKKLHQTSILSLLHLLHKPKAANSFSQPAC